MIGLYRREWNLSVPEFDLVIVGGGSAGLELARMATRAELNVALIEQGVSSGRHIFQRIPLMVGKIIGNSRFLDVWRSIPLTSAGGFARPILAGRGLGGSSRINGNVAYAGPRHRYTQVYDKIGLNFSDILRELSPGASNAAPRVHTWTDGLSELFLKSDGG
jgi:choline dehydrogenase-like flavoprotein